MIGASCALVPACLLLVACSQREPPGARAERAGEANPASAAPAPSLPAAAPAAPGATGSAAEAEAEAAPLAGFVPTRAKLVGHTSLVLKLEGQARDKAVFRAAFRQGGARYRGEIAAYRLGVALGLGAHFAEAIPQAWPKETLRALLSEADRGKLDSDVLVDEHGKVAGALVRWLSDLEMPAFEKDPWVVRWKGWLQGHTPIEPGDLALAGQFSNLVVFDYLTGNFDRWSGGNLGAVGQGPALSLRYIDNDGAFLSPMPKAPLAASQQRLLATVRFSRSLIEKLRALAARPDWTPLFGTGVDGKALLSADVARAARERAREALAHVDARAASAGDAATFPFP